MERLKVFAEEDHPYEGNIFKDYTEGKHHETVSLHDIVQRRKSL